MDGMIHRGMGSDLMGLCGLVLGCNGSDQVKLSYVDEQVTCVACLQVLLKKLRQQLAAREENLETRLAGSPEAL